MIYIVHRDAFLSYSYPQVTRISLATVNVRVAFIEPQFLWHYCSTTRVFSSAQLRHRTGKSNWANLVTGWLGGWVSGQLATLFRQVTSQVAYNRLELWLLKWKLCIVACRSRYNRYNMEECSMPIACGRSQWRPNHAYCWLKLTWFHVSTRSKVAVNVTKVLGWVGATLNK